MIQKIYGYLKEPKKRSEFAKDPKKLRCSYKGCKRTGYKFYIDGNRKNELLTNILVYCNTHFPYDVLTKEPYISVSKSCYFDSSHYLPSYSGKCHNMHGHRWKVEITLRNRVSLVTGMVMDFSELKKIMKKYIENELDHKIINDVIGDFEPTAENMLLWIWSTLEKKAKLKGITKIKLWETPDSYATLTVDDLLDSDYLATY